MIRLIVDNEAFKKPSVLEDATVRYSNKSEPLKLTEKQKAEILKKVLERASKLKW